MLAGPSRSFITGADPIPILGVSLVLFLAVFATTPTCVLSGVPVRVPTAKNPSAYWAPESMVAVFIQDDGHIYVGSRWIRAEGLELALREAIARRESGWLYVKADRRVPFGSVRPVLEAARAAGAKSVVFAACQIDEQGNIVGGNLLNTRISNPGGGQ